MLSALNITVIQERIEERHFRVKLFLRYLPLAFTAAIATEAATHSNSERLLRELEEVAGYLAICACGAVSHLLCDPHLHVG